MNINDDYEFVLEQMSDEQCFFEITGKIMDWTYRVHEDQNAESEMLLESLRKLIVHLQENPGAISAIEYMKQDIGASPDSSIVIPQCEEKH